jgi:hypothetical protein
MHHDIPAWVYIVFTAVTAAGVLMQALVLLGMLIALKKALRRMDEVSKVAEQHALPALESTRTLLEEISPKVKVTAQNLMEVSQTMCVESRNVAAALDDLLKKAAVQADRLDEMVTGTLNSVAQATVAVQRAVAAPVRQVGAVLNGLRAGFDVLRNKEREAHAAADGDHFV